MWSTTFRNGYIDNMYIMGAGINMRNSSKNGWSLFLLLLTGIVLGGFIGWLSKDVPYLSWLNFGQQFGVSEPFNLNLGILKVTFGFTIKITMSSIIGVILAIIAYKKL